MARKRTTTPSLPDDLRTRRSMAALRTALLALIEQRPLDQIAIKDITGAAGLSYQTFFRRFAGKDDLLRHIASGEIEALLTLGQAAIAGDGAPSSSTELCEHVQRHRRLWTILLTGGAAPFVREEFLRVAKQVAESRGRINPSVPLDLAARFTTSAIFEILTWWMKQPEDYPMGNIVILLDALVLDVIARPQNLALAPAG